MHSSEKLCLQWNDFQSNINSALKELRKENDMTDVTLVSEEGKQVGWRTKEVAEVRDKRRRKRLAERKSG